MKQINNLIVVEVPYGSRCMIVVGRVCYGKIDTHWIAIAELPPSQQYEIIGLGSEMDEATARKIVDKHPNIGYRDYECEVLLDNWGDIWMMPTAMESFESLLRKYELTPTEQTDLLFIKIK